MRPTFTGVFVWSKGMAWGARDQEGYAKRAGSVDRFELARLREKEVARVFEFFCGFGVG